MICRWWFASLWNCLCRQWHSLELTILTWNGAPIMLIRAKIRAKIRTKKWIIMWLQHPSINSPHTFQVSRWHITIPTTINFYKSWFCHHIMDHDNDLQLEEEKELLQEALARIQAHRKANKVPLYPHPPCTILQPWTIQLHQVYTHSSCLISLTVRLTVATSSFWFAGHSWYPPRKQQLCHRRPLQLQFRLSREGWQIQWI